MYSRIAIVQHNSFSYFWVLMSAPALSSHCIRVNMPLKALTDVVTYSLVHFMARGLVITGYRHHILPVVTLRGVAKVEQRAVKFTVSEQPKEKLEHVCTCFLVDSISHFFCRWELAAVTEVKVTRSEFQGPTLYERQANKEDEPVLERL